MVYGFHESKNNQRFKIGYLITALNYFFGKDV